MRLRMTLAVFVIFIAVGSTRAQTEISVSDLSAAACSLGDVEKCNSPAKDEAAFCQPEPRIIIVTPEPNSMLLFGSGITLIGIGSLVRRRLRLKRS